MPLPTSKHQQPNRLLKKTKQLLSALRPHITEMVVVGFNSGKYDLNVLKDILIPYLVNRSGIDLAIKHNHAYLALSTTSLKFVDTSYQPCRIPQSVSMSRGKVLLLV